MNRNILETVVTDYLGKLFAFSLRQTQNREDAEDLCQDIITEIAYSAGRIRQAEALPGWIWAIARNTCVRWIRKRQADRLLCGLLPADAVIDGGPTPEQSVIADEELSLIRREIGRLSHIHREVIVQHYLHERSCAEIAASMGLSHGMVKYHLFSARNKIKEGVSMTREPGTRNYDVRTFAPCAWAAGPEGVDGYYAALSRRLPRRILMAAYSEPATMESLEFETGVPIPYLQDEINILIETGLLEPVSGGRFETSLVIVDRELSARVDKLFIERSTEMADQLYQALITNEGVIRDIGFHGADMERSKLLWLAPNIIYLVLEYRVQPEILTYYPLTKTGAHAWLYGTEDEYQGWGAEDRQRRDDAGHELLATDVARLNRLPDRLYAHTSTSHWPALALLARMTGEGLSVEGLSSQEASECAGLVEGGLAVKRGGRMVSNVPIFTEEQYRSLWQLIRSEMGFIEAGFRKLHEEVTDIMKAHLPTRFRDLLSQYAFLRMLRAKSFVYEAFFREERLSIPEGVERHSYALVIVPSKVPVV